VAVVNYMHTIAAKFTSGVPHEKHVVATWNIGNHLSIRFKTRGNQEKPVSRWPVRAGPSGYRLLAGSPASVYYRNVKLWERRSLTA
jgi:hypothetical protein